MESFQTKAFITVTALGSITILLQDPAALEAFEALKGRTVHETPFKGFQHLVANKDSVQVFVVRYDTPEGEE